MTNKITKTSVLFVCLGNICRSPIAEGVFRAKVKNAGLENEISTDSAGTASWHTGNPPDSRMIKAAAERGIDISNQRARQVTMEDFHQFDYILAMDLENLYNLQDIDPGIGKAKLDLYLNYATTLKENEVPDPYFGGEAGFNDIINLVEHAADGLLKTITDRRTDIAAK